MHVVIKLATVVPCEAGQSPWRASGRASS